MKPEQNHIPLLMLQVEKHLQHAIALYQNLPEEDLCRKPAPLAWSAAECLWHLNSYYQFYFPEIEKALSEEVISDKDYQISWVGRMIEKMMHPEKSSQRFKAFRNHIPPAILNPYEQVGDFIDYQERLLKLLQQIAPGQLHKRIPISISTLVRLKLGDIFPFIIAHDERHLQQADRAIKGIR